MENKLTELVFLIDRSGSMCGLEKDTVGGYNSMLARQKKEAGDALVTTTLFDNELEVICDRTPIEYVRPMSEKQYCTRGCTALLDAIGSTIKYIAGRHRQLKKEFVPQKTIFIITTDGLENASKNYSYKQIKAMIRKEEEKYGWEFIFLGANIDVAKEAEKLGVRQDMAVSYENDSEGIEINYRVVSEAITCMRSETNKSIGSDWSKEIRENYKRKNK